MTFNTMGVVCQVPRLAGFQQYYTIQRIEREMPAELDK
jgi:hypothetical protein